MPSARRCADLLLAAAVVPALLISRTRSELEAARAAHRRLEDDVARLERRLDTIPALEAELEARRAVVSQLVTILPSPEIATPERLLELVQECCEQTRFVLRSGGCKSSPPRRPLRNGFREVEITMSYEGTFEQLLHFLSLIERAESFVRINSFSLTPAREGRCVSATINLSTFRDEAGW